MRLRTIIPVLLVTGLLSTQSLRADERGPVLDSEKFLDKLEAAGRDMLKSGGGKGSKELSEGLKRETCSLELPAARTEAIGDKELYAQVTESIFVVCGLYKSPESPAQGDKKRKLPEGDAWEMAFSTAFAVTADGVLTTSRHFFGDPQPCEVFLVADLKGTIYPVEEILAADEKKDTCLFRIKAEGLKPLPLGKSIAPGSKVRVVSHPGYFFWFFSAGQVGNHFEEDGTNWVNITADFGQGSSGAPVFDEFGNVIGQVTSTLTLFATGPAEEEPAVARRRIKVQAKPAEEKPEAPKKPPKKKKKKEKPVEPPPEETGEPQMVFKTCTPVEAIRSLIKQP
ncbi:MAG: serine protease [Pirellulaceae bacterium]